MGIGVSGVTPPFYPTENQNCGWAESLQRRHVNGPGEPFGGILNQDYIDSTHPNLPRVSRNSDSTNKLGATIDRIDPSQLNTMIHGSSPPINKTINNTDLIDYYDGNKYKQDATLLDDQLSKHWAESTPMGNPDWEADYKYETLYNKSGTGNEQKIIKSCTDGSCPDSVQERKEKPNDFYMWTRMSESAATDYYGDGTSELIDTKYHGIWDDFGSDITGRNIQSE